MNRQDDHIAQMNMAIALYMGWKREFSPGYFGHGEKFGGHNLYNKASYKPTEMLFCESMDWLTPVLEKIRLTHQVVIEMTPDGIICRIVVDPRNEDENVGHGAYVDKVRVIDVVFGAVYDYVKAPKNKKRKMAS